MPGTKFELILRVEMFNRAGEPASIPECAQGTLQMIKRISDLPAQTDAGVCRIVACMVKPPGQHLTPELDEVERRTAIQNGEKPQPIRRTVPRVGRNETCACGSGKKTKRCCGSHLKLVTAESEPNPTQAETYPQCPDPCGKQD